jgi:transglutaminase-like putative cysteine protease
MRVRISHETIYTYEPEVTGAIQLLRVTPRSHEGQHVARWRIETSDDGQLANYQDAFGNASHWLSIDKTFSELRILVEGEVETQDTSGLVQGALELFPPSLFLRETPITQASPEIVKFVQDACRGANNPLACMHAVQTAIRASLRFDTQATDVATSAAEAFASQHGVCQDFAHIFIGAARHLGLPARYVAGHLLRQDGEVQQEAGHAWAEVHIPDLGWVGFDPTNGICPTDAYVRVAVGLDYLGATPVRGSVFGRARESMRVAVVVEQAQQAQQ